MSAVDTQPKTGKTSQHQRESSRVRTIIAPSHGWLNLQRLHDLPQYYELFFFLVWRNISIRYKQTALGASWAIIQPVTQMIVFSLVFGRLAQMPVDGDIPYPLFNYAGLLPWQFFSASVGLAANSLVTNAAMVRKVYFPRITIPVSAVLSSLVDFALAFLVLVGLMVWYGYPVRLSILMLPVFLLLAVVTATGIGLWLSAVNAKFRDVRHATPFLVQTWLFATPVVYPSSLFPEPWRTLSGLNPMAGVVEGFRWAMLGTDPPSALIFLSVLVALVVLFSGFAVFQAMERNFADVI
jgi:lipopolysaccharide transport system permease protein